MGALKGVAWLCLRSLGREEISVTVKFSALIGLIMTVIR